MTVSTKEKIKRTALSLFAKKGYEGASMQDIAQGVGIKKASLYFHFECKEDILFAIYEDLARDFQYTLEGMIVQSRSMAVAERLYYIFEQYILYFINNPEVASFWNIIHLFTPPEVYYKFNSASWLFDHHYPDLREEPPAEGPRHGIISNDLPYQKDLEEIFAEGIRQGVIRQGNPGTMAMSYRIMQEGLLLFLRYNAGIKKTSIKAHWQDFWSGISGPSEK